MRKHETTTLIELLIRHSRERCNTRAFSHLADGSIEASRLTYGELDQRARAIAALLLRRHEPGERALLLYPPGLDFVAAFYGCLYAGVIAVPAYPPRLAGRMRGLDRCRAIARDAGVSMVLSTEPLVRLVDDISHRAEELAAAHWIATENVPLRDARYWQPPQVHFDSLAFLQYTSGSTATPKGVMISHANLMHNLEYAHHCAENDVHTVSVSWLPVYHDMGLINGVLLPVFGGYLSYLMPPAAFVQRPLVWLEAITRYKATNSGGPNFAYDLCVRNVTPEERNRLDLRTWRVAFNGAEPIRWSTLDQFYEMFQVCGFRRCSHFPVYGLAEATVLVSSGQRSDEPRAIRLDSARLAEDQAIELPESDPTSVRVTSCGPTSCGTGVAIVHPQSTLRCKDHEIGEIWVRSPSVALGYWNRPEETRRVFDARIAGSGEGPFLRTGDLGFLSRGELVVTGRLKELILVRGRKHYPHDIERTVEECHDAVRAGCVVAFASNEDGEEQLNIVAEIVRQRIRCESVLETVLAAVRESVTDRHGIQPQRVLLLRPGSMPKTSSGKLQRHVCRTMLQTDSLSSIARWDLETNALAR